MNNIYRTTRSVASASHRAILAMAVLLAVAGAVQAGNVKVTIQNMGASGSVFFTPFWIGVHDGAFDTYDIGASAAGFGGLESIAEDGSTAALSARFGAAQASGVDATVLATSIGPPPFDPGETSSMTLSVANPMVNRYFSYASMVIPSNDAFVANGNPLAHPIFDGSGNFLGPLTIDIFGSNVNDAGTEVNSETDVAFLAGANGQTGPNMGANEGGIVSAHAGFNGSIGNPAATPMNILGGTTASGATIDTVLGDFTRNQGDVLIARITVVPEPSCVVLAIIGLLGLCVPMRRRRRRVA